MYYPIKVDLGDLKEEFGLDGEFINSLSNRIVTDVANVFLQNLTNNVNTTLKGTREAYLRNVEVIAVDNNNKEIILRGWLPNAVESGIPAFDMKPNFAQSSKVQYNKEGGWYLRIPFKFGTPTSLAEGIQKIPTKIYNIVRKQSAPLSENQIPEPFNLRQVREEIRNQTEVFPEYQHKSSIYAGLQKTSGGYQTIRTVGSNSPSNAFIHKGIKPVNLFDRTLNQISPDIPIIADNAINEYLSKLGV